MKLNYKFRKICLFFAAFIAFSGVIYSQAPSRSNFNVVFENNFEDDALGRYQISDYIEDWNPQPNSLSSQEIIDIMADPNSAYNKVMRGYYPEGTYLPDQHGFLWRSYLDVPATELYFSYDINFKPGFEWVIGGKIPGIVGGNVMEGANPPPDAGFSVRIMWKEEGEFVFYVYHQDQDITPGNSYLIPGFKCIPGNWYNVTIRVVLNTITNGVAANDGILEGYIDGRLLFQKTNFKFRSLPGIKIDNMYITSFFGGSTAIWAALRNEWIDFDNFVAYTYSSSATNVPRGNQPASKTRTLLHPLYSFNTTQSSSSVPATPSGLTSTAVSKSTVSLKWNDNSGNEQGFRIFRSLSPDQGYTEVKSAGANATTIQDINLQPVTKYYYKVNAYNQSGTSGFSPVYEITTDLLDLPSAPSLFTSTAQTQSSISLSWKDNSSREKGFELFRSNNANDGFITVDSCEANETSCVDETVRSATTYYYKIRAFNTDGVSDFTPVLQVASSRSGTPTTVNRPPDIGNQAFTVKSSTFSGNRIGQILASDPDGQSLKFSILSGNTNNIFSVDPNTGLLNATYEIFGSETLKYNLVIEVSDNASTPLKSSATITVNALNEAKIVYIDPDNSDDVSANGSIFHPYDSWTDITWKSGYTYLQKKGTDAVVDRIQIGASNVTLGAYGDGTTPIISSVTNTYLISGFEKSGISIRDLNLQASNAVSCIYFLGTSTDSIKIDHCIIRSSANAIKVVDGTNLIVRYNHISSDQEGLYSTAKFTEVYYNIFNGCNTAANIMSNSSVARIFNNVFLDNARSVSVSYADLTLYNNIFYMTSQGQNALSQGTGKLVSDCNIYFPEQPGFIKAGTKIFNNLDEYQKGMNVDMKSFTSDPQFVDVINENYLVAATSPAINSGKNLAVKTDYYSNKVPMFGTADIGIFEFNGNLSKPGSEKAEDKIKVKVYPNPTNGPVTVEALINEDFTTEEPTPTVQEMKVVDMTGRTLLSKKINSNNNTIYQDRIDLSGFRNGLYFVVIQISDKVVKERVLLSK